MLYFLSVSGPHLSSPNRVMGLLHIWSKLKALVILYENSGQ